MLTSVSVVSVLCAASVWLYTAPQLISSGVVEVGGLVELMVVLPTLVGLVCSLMGAIAGVLGALFLRDRALPAILMTVGQVLTMAVAVTIVVWALAFASTGWELIVLPTSLMLGQIVVAAGLILGRRRRAVRI